MYLAALPWKKYQQKKSYEDWWLDARQPMMV